MKFRKSQTFSLLIEMKRDTPSGMNDGPPAKFQRPTTDLSRVSIRFLIPGRAAGIMIGKGGENIKKIRSQVCCDFHVSFKGGSS